MKRIDFAFENLFLEQEKLFVTIEIYNHWEFIWKINKNLQ